MKYYLVQGDAVGKVSLACIADKEQSGKIVMYNVTGQVAGFKRCSSVPRNECL